MSRPRLPLLAAAATLWVAPVFAQISGVVMNTTSEKPQAGVTVNLIHPGENGMQVLATVKSDADKAVPPPPALLRAEYQGVEYNLILQPGAPASGVRVSVYDATSQPSAAALSQQHLLVVEPSTDGIRVNETFLIQNTGKTTFSDLVKGSAQFYLPKDAQGNAKVTVEAPSGMPITRAPEKTSQADVFKVGYPIKPGETVFEVGYSLPASQKFTGKAIGQGQTLLVTPEGVTMTGDSLKDDGIKDLGQGGVRAHVYEVTAKPGALYEAGIEGTGTLSTPNAGSEDNEDDNESPKPKAGPPRVFQRLPLVLGLAFGILGLGGALLYRRSAA